MEIFLVGIGIMIGIGVAYFVFRKIGDRAQKAQSINPLEAKIAEQRRQKEERKEKILAALAERGRITNNEVEEMLGVSDATATNYFQELEDEGKIVQKGAGRSVYYELI